MRALLVAFAFLLTTATAQAQETAAADTLVMQLKDGEVRIALNVDGAPKHAERLKTLANKGFYDGLKFHRVIPGFMAQTGDPQGTGMGGSDLPDLEAEFTEAAFDRGVVGMARSADPNSANSQFFIMFAPAPDLDGKYTVIGNVVSGMEAVDAIKKGAVADNGTVDHPDTIVKMRTADKTGS